MMASWNYNKTGDLYSCKYEKTYLKDPDNMCSGINHTEKVDGVYINETDCVESVSYTHLTLPTNREV